MRVINEHLNSTDVTQHKIGLVNRNSRPSHYTVQDLLTKKIFQVAASRLRPFYYDSRFTDPKEVRLHDDQEFYIDKIIEHVGDTNRLSSLYFKVRWVGYNDENDSWEPWKSLRNTQQLHDYLYFSKLDKLVPREHRRESHTQRNTRITNFQSMPSTDELQDRNDGNVDLPQSELPTNQYRPSTKSRRSVRLRKRTRVMVP